MYTLYKLRDSLIGLHCVGANCIVSRVTYVSYGTDNVISIYNTGNRMHFDHAVCVIRAGEIGMFNLIETS